MPLNTFDDFFCDIKDKKVAFVGLGRSNMPLVKMFVQKGIKVIVCDKHKLSNSQLSFLKKLDVDVRTSEDYLKKLDMDIIFRTPALNFFDHDLQRARKRGIVVTSEVELFFSLCPCKIIAVTGSDGKTTTTTIISQILKNAGYTVHLGGNIGNPLLPIVNNIKPSDYCVVELSSFQLVSMTKSPDIAVVTNVSPNHLDIHRDMREYVDAKKNIVLHQDAFSTVVLNAEDEICNSFSAHARGKVFYFDSKSEVENGCFIKDGGILFVKNGIHTPVMKTEQILLTGKHNLKNYLAAITAVFELVSVENIKNVAKTFEGVEHRIEFVKEVNGIKFYNDSIATSPSRVINGVLALYDKKITMICGGYDKNLDFAKLGDVINKKVKTLVVMGKTSTKIRDAVSNSLFYGAEKIKILEAQNMEEAVNLAFKHSSPSDIIALSPASTSFDLYKDFEERGNHFKKIVNAL